MWIESGNGVKIPWISTVQEVDPNNRPSRVGLPVPKILGTPPCRCKKNTRGILRTHDVPDVALVGASHLNQGQFVRGKPGD